MNVDAVQAAVAAHVSLGAVQIEPGEVEVSSVVELTDATFVCARWSYEDMRETQPVLLLEDGQVVFDRDVIVERVMRDWVDREPAGVLEQARVVARTLGYSNREQVIATAEEARACEAFLAADRAAKPGVRLSVPIEPPTMSEGLLSFWVEHDYGPTRVQVRAAHGAVEIRSEDADLLVAD